MAFGPSPTFAERSAPLRIVAVYAFFAALWILFSDLVVGELFSDPVLITRVSLVKGWLFVAITSALLFFLIRRNLDDLWQKQDQLRRNEQQLLLSAKVFESASEGIIITDANTNIQSVNDAALEMSGYCASELIGHNPRLLQSGRHDAQFYQEMWRALSGQGHWQGELWNRRKNGEVYPVWMGISAVRDDAGSVTNYVGICADITERMAAERQIQYLAYHDTLTGLPNRLLLYDRFAQARAYADRARTRVALLFLDIDNFKTVNDSLGHGIGDQLLMTTAQRLAECVRDTDTISRQGGDEFLILLPDLPDADAAAPVLVKIRERLQEPLAAEGQELSTSVSIGVAIYPEDGKDLDTLLKKADTAMYRAKDAGRNTYRFFDEQMNVEAVEHLAMRNGLRRALERGEFVLHYQPQHDLIGGQVTGVEALIRWRHPELGMVAPGRFIPVAEESGLIVPIGAWVLGEACRQAMRWRQAGLPELLMSVNLSSVQFKRGDVEKTILQALEESGFDPALLELEMTESILIHNTESVLATVRRLKLLGVKLAIDDFGTGYSSLSYLKRFDVDKLKIDQSFIRDLASDADDAAIVRAIIQMARSLSLTTVAEGVEDQRVIEHLRVFHCDQAQGYHYARPMPAEEFAAYLGRMASGAG